MYLNDERILIPTPDFPQRDEEGAWLCECCEFCGVMTLGEAFEHCRDRRGNKNSGHRLWHFELGLVFEKILPRATGRVIYLDRGGRGSRIHATVRPELEAEIGFWLLAARGDQLPVLHVRLLETVPV